jgi:SAM-dependent methyltransferase
MEAYFSGEKLYGDDFTAKEIGRWYADEKEGYAQLISEKRATYNYGYHEVNKKYGFKYLPHKRYLRALGIGSALGEEFVPILSLIDQLFILEPSDALEAPFIGGVQPQYVKPHESGEMDFPGNFFDLIVCFDTLHHIPNVSYVLSEAYRCLRKGGYFLVKEPIGSMGDWRHPRPGLTKRERGIPYSYFLRMFDELGFKIVRQSRFFTVTSFLERKTKKILPKPIFSYRSYLWIDQILSRVFCWNLVYHPRNRWQRIAPSSVFFVLSK